MIHLLRQRVIPERHPGHALFVIGVLITLSHIVSLHQLIVLRIIPTATGFPVQFSIKGDCQLDGQAVL